MAKGDGKSKGHGKDPAGRVGNRKFKMDLCTYHMSGRCVRGTECPFAHGEHELRCKPGGKDGKDGKDEMREDAEVMAWLQGMRQDGQAGEEFEKHWKAWCKVNDVHGAPKLQRIKRIHAFRLDWEAGRVTSDPTLQAILDRDRGWEPPEKPPEKREKPQKAPKGLQNLKAEATCPKGHFLEDKICLEVEEFGCDSCGVDITEGGRIFDCRECDYTLCTSCGTSCGTQEADRPDRPAEAQLVRGQDPSREIRERPEITSVLAGAPAQLSSCTNSSNSCPQKHKLMDIVCEEGVEYACNGCRKDIRCGEILYNCEPCDYCLCDACVAPEAPEAAEDFPKAAWDENLQALREKLLQQRSRLRLDDPMLGRPSVALLSACQQRCSRLSGPLLFAGSGSLQSIVTTCLGAQNLSALAAMLQLSAMFPVPELSQEDLAKALLEALLRYPGLSEFQTLCDALLDFVCLLGFTHFVAVGVTHSFPEPQLAVAGEGAQDAQGLVKPEETEAAARARRVREQQQKMSTKKWDYTGGYRPAEGTETNEQATLRLLKESGINLPARSRDAGFLGAFHPSCAAEVPREARGPKGGPKGGVGGPRNFKKDLCIDFEKGYCSRNTSCTFAHGVEEQKAARELYENQKKGHSGKELPKRYKRDLCYYFERNGTCVKGDDCTYAHGQEEQFRADVKELVCQEESGVTVHQGPSWEVGPSALGSLGRPTRKVI